jgi:hypothetical protein
MTSWFKTLSIDLSTMDTENAFKENSVYKLSSTQDVYYESLVAVRRHVNDTNIFRRHMFRIDNDNIPLFQTSSIFHNLRAVWLLFCRRHYTKQRYGPMFFQLCLFGDINIYCFLMRGVHILEHCYPFWLIL